MLAAKGCAGFQSQPLKFPGRSWSGTSSMNGMLVAPGVDTGAHSKAKVHRQSKPHVTSFHPVLVVCDASTIVLSLFH
jgi:hypothetical protein